MAMLVAICFVQEVALSGRSSGGPVSPAISAGSRAHSLPGEDISALLQP